MNLDAFARVMSDALGIQVAASDLAALGVPGSTSTAGTVRDGKVTLVAGLVVVVCAILFLAVENARKAARVLMIVGGLGGVGVTVLNLLAKGSQIDQGLAKVGPQLSKVGISLDAFKSVFQVQWGIGIYVCLVGGPRRARRWDRGTRAGGSRVARPWVVLVGNGIRLRDTFLALDRPGADAGRSGDPWARFCRPASGAGSASFRPLTCGRPRS
ncbi:MAG: hypothetical protein HY240_04895 [Actinobacteria bacterium]|nr:hypothetical protein [Actinomycetota bacterium]